MKNRLKKSIKKIINNLSVRNKTLIAPIFSSICIFFLGIIFFSGIRKQHVLISDINKRYNIYKQSAEILVKIKVAHTNLYKGFVWASTGYNIKNVKKLFKETFKILKNVSLQINKIIKTGNLLKGEKKSFKRIKKYFKELKYRSKVSVESVFAGDISAASMIMQMGDDQFNILYKSMQMLMRIQDKITLSCYKKSENSLHFFTLLNILLIIFSFVLSIIVSFIISGYIEKPIRYLIDFLRRIFSKKEKIIKSLHEIRLSDKSLEKGINIESNDEIGEFASYFNRFIDEINTANKDRTVAMSKLEKSLKEIKEMQEQIILQEKMASLGQLITGIAHEINSPLGAIRSSVSVIVKTLEKRLEELPVFFRTLSENQLNFFLTIFNKSINKKNFLSSKEERKFKRMHIKELEKKNIEEAHTIADTLVDMGIYDNIDELIPLLKEKESFNIIQVAEELTELLRSAQNIIIAADRSNKVIFALKKYSYQKKTDEMIESDIKDNLETVLTLYHNKLKQGVEVVRDYEEVPAVLCYPDELAQVWTNLIENAIQAMENKGILKISIKKTDKKVLVSFTNTGPSISAENLPRIFEPFFTTKGHGEGTGLGLDICKKIIEKHNGEINVETSPVNTTFTISLFI